MPKHLSKNSNSEPSLGRILILVSLAVAVVLIGLQGYAWWKRGGGVNTASANDKTAEVLASAEAAAQTGDWEKTRELLEPLTEQLPGPSLAPRVLLLTAEAHENLGDRTAAVSLVRRALEDYGDSPMYPEAAAHYARLLEESGQTEKAQAAYAQVLREAPPGMRASSAMGLARLALKRGNEGEARQSLHQALQDTTLDSPAWSRAADMLGELNTTAIFSPAETGESKFYLVEPGDNLIDIGIKLNTTQGLLTRANGIDDPSRLRVNQRLKHTPKDFQIVIERATCRLFLLDNDGLFKRYYCGLGMPGYETTLGSYTIGNKQKDPTWFKPGAEPIPPGDPENELGTRWMPLVPAQEGLPTDLGIHGTIAPETIGQYKSHGCPRMKKADVEELYDLVVRSTPVHIVEHFNPREMGWNIERPKPAGDETPPVESPLAMAG